MELRPQLSNNMPDIMSCVSFSDGRILLTFRIWRIKTDIYIYIENLMEDHIFPFIDEIVIAYLNGVQIQRLDRPPYGQYDISSYIKLLT